MRTDAPLLRTEGLSRHFGGLLAVDGLSFELRSSEIFGLIGPNGAGNLISGFIRPSAGRVEIDGRDLTGRGALAVSRAGLVRTFQHGSYVRSMGVRDNLRLGAIAHARPAERGPRVEATAAELGLTPVLDEVAGTLPHGVRRLVSIATAIVAQPRLLCLDEPLTGLNETEVGEVLGVLDRYRMSEGRAVLLVEHNMKAVMKICDRILVPHHGAPLASGTPAEIQSNPKVIEAYLGERRAH
jgi:branched-chain amino acid transport system ATP-binding protein